MAKAKRLTASERAALRREYLGGARLKANAEPKKGKSKATVQFLLRLSENLKAAIEDMADKRGTNMTIEILRILEENVGKRL